METKFFYQFAHQCGKTTAAKLCKTVAQISLDSSDAEAARIKMRVLQHNGESCKTCSQFLPAGRYNCTLKKIRCKPYNLCHYWGIKLLSKVQTVYPEDIEISQTLQDINDEVKS